MLSASTAPYRRWGKPGIAVTCVEYLPARHQTSLIQMRDNSVQTHLGMYYVHTC